MRIDRGRFGFSVNIAPLPKRSVVIRLDGKGRLRAMLDFAGQNPHLDRFTVDQFHPIADLTWFAHPQPVRQITVQDHVDLNIRKTVFGEVAEERLWGKLRGV